MPPPSTEDAFQDAMRRAQAGDMPGVESKLRECLALNPRHAAALLNLGIVLTQRRAFDEAKAVLTQALTENPTVEALTMLGSIYKETQDLEKAEQCFRQILQAIPKHAPSLARLGEIYELKDDPNEARRLFEEAWRTDPRDANSAIRYAVLSADKDLDIPARVMDEILSDPKLKPKIAREAYYKLLPQKEFSERKKRGLPPYHALSLDELFFRYATDDFTRLRALHAAEAASNAAKSLQGLVVSHFCAREFDKASHYLHALHAAEPGGLWDSVQLDPAYHEKIEATPDNALFGGLPPIIDLVSAAFSEENVIFLSCDASYFGSFGMPMMRSLADVGPGSQIQLHIMDGSDSDWGIIKAFCASLNALTIGITAERTGMQAAGPEAARGYYHSIRFVRYFQTLKRLNRTLWMMDVDALFNRPPRELYPMIGDMDVAFRVRAGRLEPWNQFSAAIVGARPREASLCYFRGVAGYLAERFSAKALKWGIDQTAMFAVYFHLMRTQRHPHLSFLGETAMDLMHSDEGVLWVSAGRKKFLMLMAGAKSGPGDRYQARFEKYRA